jgi:hypothetical protein
MNDITFYEKIENPMEAIEKLGGWLAKSGMFGCEKVEQGIVLAMACMAEKKNPIEIKKKYHLIGGSLTMRSDAMLAEFRQRGGKVKWIDYGSEKAGAEFTLDENKILLSYTIEEARAAGLVREKSGWVKHPDAMLRARLISKAVRMLCPEAICGIYTAEEVEEFDRSQNKPLLPPLQTTEEMPAEKLPAEETEIDNATRLKIISATGKEKLMQTEIYLSHIGWLDDGQSIQDIAPVNASMILDRPQAFCIARDQFISSVEADNE